MIILYNTYNTYFIRRKGRDRIMTESLRPWIREAQKGDKDAIEFLTKQYEPLVHQVANMYTEVFGSHEDAVSVGWETLLTGIHNFDLTRSVDVHYYFVRFMHNHVRNEARPFYEYMKHVDDVYDDHGYKTDLPSCLTDPHSVCPETHAIRRHLLYQIEKSINELPEQNRIVMKGIHNGMSLLRISQEYHIKYATLYRLHEKSVDYLRQVMEKVKPGHT